MSIANALTNAISGLTAASRGTEVVSTNLANALTPGYARRELELSPRVLAGNGGGVHVDGVSRIVSDTVLADLRLSNAGLARASVSFDFNKSLEASIGLPQDSGSLSALMSGLETSLVSAASRPESEIRLQSVFDAATQLVGKIASISATIQESRTQADRKIDLHVQSLNSDLTEVARLNRQIIVERANGRDSASLEDARQLVIDRISSIVPVREMPRENGRIALFTTGGLSLLDGKTPTKFGFAPTGRLTPDIDQSSALLGQLTIDGEAASATQLSLLSGGSLSAQFSLRDTLGVDAQAKVDSIARELHDRFADQSLDPTIAAAASGLFTDGSGSFDPANERGLSARLRVNAAVDPAQGGALWRIRDGIYAGSQGDVGDSGLINDLAQAMTKNAPYSSSAALGGEGGIGALASNVLSYASTARLAAETQRTHDTSLQSSLQNALYADGVDSDRELQMLLQIETAYAANAKVIKAIDEMLDNILRI